MPETCANCGRTIGNLETPHVVGDNVVCADCADRLKRSSIVPASAPQSASHPGVYQRSYSPHPATNIYIAAPQQKGTSILGVIAVILASIALMSAWIPFLGLLSIPVIIIAFILACLGFLISFFGRKSSTGIPIGGILMSIIALIVSLGSTGAFVGAMNRGQATTNRTNQQIISGPSSPGSATPATPVSNANSWAPWNAVVMNGDIQIQITGVSVGTISLTDAVGNSTFDSSDKFTSIRIHLTNTSPVKKYSYKSWEGADISFDRDYASLVDEHDNVYKRESFGLTTKAAGSVEDADLYPGKSIDDVLVFQPPIDGIDHLDLEMPAGNIGGNGMIRFRIPASVIQR